MKYQPLLEALEDDQLYSAATVVRYCEACGLFEAGKGLFAKPLTTEELSTARQRIRHTLARFASNHDFPFYGDGLLQLPGQTTLRGWYGWRWKQAIGKRRPVLRGLPAEDAGGNIPNEGGEES